MTDPIVSLLLIMGLMILFVGTIIGGIVFMIAVMKGKVITQRIGFAQGTRPESRIEYRRAPSLLTASERHFYDEMRGALDGVQELQGQLAVQCKVRLADVLLAPAGDLRAFRQVSQKHVDFLICERRSLRPILAIELDDRSHQQYDRQARDAFVDSAYASAGLPVLHVAVQHNYNPDHLRSLILPYLPVHQAQP